MNIYLLDQNENHLNEIKHLLITNDYNVIGAGTECSQVYDYLKKNTIDVLLMDLVCDGLEVLDQLNNHQNKPKHIIVFSYFHSNYVLQKLAEYKIDYFLLKPFNKDYLLELLDDFDDEMLSSNDMDQAKLIEKRIGALFTEIGIPRHIKGYYYLKEAVRFLYEHQEPTINLKSIYLFITSKYKTTNTKIDNSIRHVIDIVYFRGNIEVLISNKDIKLSNYEFIYSCVKHLKA